MKTNLKGFIMGKFGLFGLAALVAAVFALGSCEQPGDSVTDTDLNKATVTGVTITPVSAEEPLTVARGGTIAFEATVDGENEPSQNVDWSVDGSDNENTFITDGVLNVAADESSEVLTVRATSTADSSQYDEVTVIVNSEIATVTTVTVTPATTTVARGESVLFTVEVTGTYNPAATVTWTIAETTIAEGTAFSGNTLNVDADENTETLTITATSTVTPTILSDPVTITVTASPVNDGGNNGEDDGEDGTTVEDPSDTIDDDPSNDVDDDNSNNLLDGTTDDDGNILIASVATFAKIGNADEIKFPLNGKYKQIADITIGTSDSWTPIGTIDSTSTTNAFTGTFDGNNNKIIADNLTYNSAFSFFGTTNGAELKNIHIEGSITISETSAGNTYLSGIATFAKDTDITNCSNAANLIGKMTSTGGVAGIVGRIGGTSTIDGCVNSGTITSGGQYAGGIVANQNTTIAVVIQNCFNSGNITSSYVSIPYVGGIVGVTAAGYKIIACKNSGQITIPSEANGTSYAGGIAGNVAGAYSTLGAHIIACYNIGSFVVIGETQTQQVQDCYVGGIAGAVGSAASSIIACYSLGAITDQSTQKIETTTGSKAYAPLFGGIIGKCTWGSNNSATPTDCYWKVDGVNYGIGAKYSDNKTSSSADSGCTQFNDSAPTGTGWGTGHNFESNQYWENLGDGSTTFPKLWWEE
jgi:hypothetical protein